MEMRYCTNFSNSYLLPFKITSLPMLSVSILASKSSIHPLRAKPGGYRATHDNAINRRNRNVEVNTIIYV